MNSWVKGGSCYLEDMHSVFDMDGLAYRFGAPSPFFTYALVVMMLCLCLGPGDLLMHGSMSHSTQ